MIASVSYILIWVIWIVGVIGIPLIVTRIFTSGASNTIARRLIGCSPEDSQSKINAFAPTIAKDARLLAESARILWILSGIAILIDNILMTYSVVFLSGCFVLAYLVLLMSIGRQVTTKLQ